jgi:carbon-monoxide dehydrogenase medium subunit
MTIRGESGERTVPAEEFFLGVYMTAVGEGELLTTVSVPAAARAADGFASVTIGRDGTCIANAAANVSDPGVTLVLGCVDAVPVLVRPAGADDESVLQAVAGANLDPPSDVHGSAEYRRHLAGICAVRAVQQATTKGG